MTVLIDQNIVRSIIMINKNQKSQIKSALLQLGFSEKEILVYLSVLQNSESSILTIANETRLSRGTTYDIVEGLKNKGFLAEIKKGKKRRIVAESPTGKFYTLLDKKHEELEKSQKTVEEILPIIKAINIAEDFKPQVRVYEGESGFKKVWDEILQYKEKKFLSIARIETFIEFAGEEFLQELQKRKIKLGFFSRAINEDSDLARKMQVGDVKFNRETRLAPKEFKFSTTEIIFGDKIAMFSTRDENIILVIESKHIAETHRVYFEMLWKMLEFF